MPVPHSGDVNTLTISAQGPIIAAYITCMGLSRDVLPLEDQNRIFYTTTEDPAAP